MVAAFAFIQHGSMKVLAFPSSVMPGGELAMLFCFIWLHFSAAGAGAWSLDALRGGKGMADA